MLQHSVHQPWGSPDGLHGLQFPAAPIQHGQWSRPMGIVVHGCLPSPRLVNTARTSKSFEVSPVARQVAYLWNASLSEERNFEPSLLCDAFVSECREILMWRSAQSCLTHILKPHLLGRAVPHASSKSVTQLWLRLQKSVKIACLFSLLACAFIIRFVSNFNLSRYLLSCSWRWNGCFSNKMWEYGVCRASSRTRAENKNNCFSFIFPWKHLFILCLLPQSISPPAGTMKETLLIFWKLPVKWLGSDSASNRIPSFFRTKWNNILR